jgi:hypothetical protein
MSARRHLVLPVPGSEQVRMANRQARIRGSRASANRPGLENSVAHLCGGGHQQLDTFCDHEFAAGQLGDAAHASADTESAQARHADAGPDEMRELADKMREIFREAGHPLPASDVLYVEIDKRLQADCERGSRAVCSLARDLTLSSGSGFTFGGGGPISGSYTVPAFQCGLNTRLTIEGWHSARTAEPDDLRGFICLPDPALSRSDSIWNWWRPPNGHVA